MRTALPVALLASLLLACPSPPIEDVVVEIGVQRDSSELTPLGLEAVELSPAWLRHDVGVALRLQLPDRADELALLIIDAADPRYIDEIAFAVAHVSPEVLADDDFVPGLLAENAELIYARDPQLDFVELTEFGEAGVDDDFWTATTYTWERDGVPVQETVERDVYYWYVVHPRLEDEHPWYVDAWSPCASQTLQCAADAETGDTWRAFLWETAAEQCPEGGWCPVLREFVGNDRVTDDETVRLDIAWNGLGGGDARGAVREVVEWMFSASEEGQRWLVFGAQGERSIQPNRIYGLGRGNCGEWADMTSAALRTILMPGLNVKPTSWDHTWNSFWTGDRWAEMEPVNYCIDCTYHGSPATVGARGDTSQVVQTADYSDETFTMEVEVLDDEGEPVVGAAVRAFAPWVIDDQTYWDTAAELPTDVDGIATFVLEIGHRFGVRVETPLGSWPEEDNTLDDVLDDDVPADATERVTAEMDWDLPASVDLTVDPATGPAAVTVAFAGQEGRALTTSQRFRHLYSTPTPAPDLELLLVDQAGYEAFKSGDPVVAAWAGDATDTTLELPEGQWWYLVLFNRSLSVAAVGDLTVSAGEESLGNRYQILPGGYLALVLDPQ